MGDKELTIFKLAKECRAQWEEWIPWLGSEIVSGISWWNFWAALLVLFFAGIVHLILGWLIGKKLREDSKRGFEERGYERAMRRWTDQLLEGLQAPIGLLIWVWGGFFAVSILFLSWRDFAEPPVLLAGLDWLRDLAIFLILIWFLFRLINVIDVLLCRRADRSSSSWDRILAPLVGRTLRLLLPLVAVVAGLPVFPVSENLRPTVKNGLSILVIVLVAMILFQTVRALEEGIFENFRVDVADNLRARKIHTQVAVLAKVAMIVIGIFGLASILMVFEPLRQFGTSILASAGIAGIILGFAAQRSLGTLMAGFQIAITQPIRFDDVVIVEEEWGRIEEITLTYVVVKLWDLRRLVLPIDYFIRQPFQNWTRKSANLLGAVYLYMDYTVPVSRIREALDEILKESKLWDGEVKGVQVTEANEQTVELRILVSSPDAGSAFDLRCEVREKMIEYIRRHFPDALPRFRAEIRSGEKAIPALENKA